MEKPENDKLYESEKKLINKVFMIVCIVPPLLYLILSLVLPKSAILSQVRSSYFQIYLYGFSIMFLTLIWVFTKRHQQGRSIIPPISKVVLKKSIVFTVILISATLLLIYYQNRYYYGPKVEALNKKYEGRMAAKQKAKETQNISKPK
jgi:hypothetical protein